ncbi:outer membrane beta-barrel protein [Muricauda sp. JGD-17]|uniref:Outer membrane beta-barrel protein n=1 Tax=Flagellimonas ochracea TaxID=2696472 RepID=A0A964TG16_9FLAO|nr:outer membrane beta-barrel protein [Allomuricauda ochracea]NAY93466.1 outer membrane beta-barrel protein [Allomuricauda ochracea]
MVKNSIYYFISKILIFALLFFNMVAGQKGKLSAELSHPIPIGDNYFNDFYTGSVDIGAQYRIVTTEVINFGASLNVGFYSFENENFNIQPDINATFIQPRAFAEAVAGFFRFQLGVGYGFATFSTQNALEPGETETVRDRTNGPNINTAVTFDVFKGLFVKGQYDYLRISEFGSLDDSDFVRNVNLVKVGLGYRF